MSAPSRDVATFSRRRTWRWVRAAGVCAALTAVAPAHADSSRAAAARKFDSAVAHFDRAEYAVAAREFLEADRLAPNADAIRNAITAAQKASEYLLVVEAAERGMERKDQELATASRDALAEAARSLSRLDLSCEPTPCAITLDGTETKAARRYVLPGTHTVTATDDKGGRAEEHVNAVAGATYTLAFHVAPPPPSPQPGASPPSEPPEPREKRDGADQQPSTAHKPLTPAFFYGGVAVSAIFLGVTVWSGIDTLSAKSDLPVRTDPRYSGAREDVYAKARRSDILFGTTVFLGGLTTAAAFLWVDWGTSDQSTSFVPVPGGGLVTTRGRF